MPVQYWYTESGATHNINSDTWTNSGGANKNASIRIGGGRTGPVTHDDDTTYIVSSASGQLQDCNVDWPGPVSALVSGYTFTAYWRHRATQNTPQRLLRFVHDDGTQGGDIDDQTDNNTAYVTDGPVDISNGVTYSPNASAWTPSDINESANYLNVQVEHQVAVTTVRVTSVWGQLEFSPPAAAWYLVLGLTAAPFVGALTDLGHFMAYMDWNRLYHRRHTILRPWEVREAFSSVRAYPHTRYCIL